MHEMPVPVAAETSARPHLQPNLPSSASPMVRTASEAKSSTLLKRPVSSKKTSLGATKLGTAVVFPAAAAAPNDSCEAKTIAADPLYRYGIVVLT